MPIMRHISGLPADAAKKALNCDNPDEAIGIMRQLVYLSENRRWQRRNLPPLDFSSPAGRARLDQIELIEKMVRVYERAKGVSVLDEMFLTRMVDGLGAKKHRRRSRAQRFSMESVKLALEQDRPSQALFALSRLQYAQSAPTYPIMSQYGIMPIYLRRINLFSEEEKKAQIDELRKLVRDYEKRTGRDVLGKEAYPALRAIAFKLKRM